MLYTQIGVRSGSVGSGMGFSDVEAKKIRYDQVGHIEKGSLHLGSLRVERSGPGACSGRVSACSSSYLV